MGDSATIARPWSRAVEAPLPRAVEARRFPSLSPRRVPMELPSRSRGDVLLPPGEMTSIRARLRRVAPRHDLRTVIACAFDHRTRILPFIFADLRIVPAGVRAIGSALM